MSQDFEIAIEEGSTMIRIGTSIFGLHIFLPFVPKLLVRRLLSI